METIKNIIRGTAKFLLICGAAYVIGWLLSKWITMLFEVPTRNI